MYLPKNGVLALLAVAMWKKALPKWREIGFLADKSLKKALP